MSPHDREITESIKSLKTLTVRDGRVSIDPREVLLQPGYLEDRKRAAQLIKRNPPSLEMTREWGSLSDSQVDELARFIALRLKQSQRNGLGLCAAIDELKTMAEETWR